MIDLYGQADAQATPSVALGWLYWCGVVPGGARCGGVGDSFAFATERFARTTAAVYRG